MPLILQFLIWGTALYLVLGVVLTLLGQVRDEPLSVWVRCILTLPIVCAVMMAQAGREKWLETSQPITLKITGEGPLTREGE